MVADGRGQVRVAYTVVQSWHRVPGGTASSVLALARALGDRDDVDLVGIGSWFGGVPAAPWTPPMPWRRVPLPYQLLYDVWHHTPFFPPRWFAPDADVVHATVVTVPPRGKVPLVVTLHDLFPLSHPEQFTRRGTRIMTDGIARARQHADVVCVPSEHTLDDCLAAGFDRSRLRVVPWGATRAEVSADDRRAVREAHRLHRRFVLWVGTIEPRKNLPTLLDAFGSIGPAERDVDLVLVGPVGWHEQLEGHIEGIGSHVRQLGFVSDTELAALYAEAEVFCFPSLREGFGLPALEAMAQGTPVIAAADTAVAEVVGEGGLAVDATDVAAWADALSSLLDDPARCGSLGAAAEARAATYSWDACAAQYAAVYHELAG